jgi:hypothetical protein
MSHMRRATLAIAVLWALAFPPSAGAALTRITGQARQFPLVAGGTVVWQAEGQGTVDGTGAFVWSAPANGSSAAKVLFQGASVPNEGVVGTDPNKTTPGQQPAGVAASPAFVYFARQTGVFKTISAGTGSPNTYTDFYATTTDDWSGPPSGPLVAITLSPDPGDPCPSGTESELPLGLSGATLVTFASCSGPGLATQRLLARNLGVGGASSSPVLLAGNGHSIGGIRVAGGYLAGIQSVPGSIQKSIVVLRLTTGAVVNTIPKSPPGSFYGALDVGSDGSVVATRQRTQGGRQVTSLVRFAAGSSRGQALPSSIGNVISAPRIAGSRIVFLRSASGGRAQIVSTNPSGGSLQTLGTIQTAADPLGGFDAGDTWIAVSGTVNGQPGIYTTRVSGS